MVTGGVTRPQYPMRYDTVLVATAPPVPDVRLQPEAAQALRMCRRQGWCSVAEIAATIGQPVLVTQIILSDLIARGALADPRDHPDANPHDPSLLRDLLDGLHALA
ncbi:hypothetical protein GCM10022254_74950 [Actinomadura meridiana]|uniref:DUF742 domain-containing protein n=2 Tax=Actinomadura meridiana TaxID=559626 RepID=A0ABP8CR65_9ACTN